MVSIVIPVRNEANAIRACLESILGQTYPASAVEIIVVDGRSTDRTAEIVSKLERRHPARLRLLDNPAGTTATGLNVGILASRGEIVGVASGHSVLPAAYIERGVASLVDTGAWAVGGRIRRVSDGATQRAIALATASPFGVGDANHNFETAAGEVEAVFPGLWPRWVFDKVGLFDPTMLSNEDNEFSVRIRKAGGRIWLDPEIVIEYRPRTAYGDLFRQYERYGRGKVRVASKHPGSLRPRHVLPALWVGGVAVGAPLAVASSFVRVPFVAAVAAYVIVLSYGATRIAAGMGVVRVVIAFMTLHSAYGAGFWHGILERVADRGRSGNR